MLSRCTLTSQPRPKCVIVPPGRPIGRRRFAGVFGLFRLALRLCMLWGRLTLDLATLCSVWPLTSGLGSLAGRSFEAGRGSRQIQNGGHLLISLSLSLALSPSLSLVLSLPLPPSPPPGLVGLFHWYGMDRLPLVAWSAHPHRHPRPRSPGKDKNKPHKATPRRERSGVHRYLTFPPSLYIHPG